MNEKKVLLVAHRGGRNFGGVENTIEAFKGGVKSGCDGLECDIRITKDDIIVISHDATLTRLTEFSPVKSDIDVNQAYYSEIKDIQLSQVYKDGDGTIQKGYICLFKDYLNLCKEKGVFPIIEIKWTNGMYSDNEHPENYDFSKMEFMIDMIKEAGLYEEAIIITSMSGCLKYIREHHPNIGLQQLIAKPFGEYIPLLKKYRVDVDVYYEALSKELVDECHKNGIKVNIWTLNDPNLYEHYVNMGVDMITSDRLSPLTLFKNNK